MAWEARAAPHPAMGRFVTTVPLDARASSLDALEALRRGDPAAAAQLRDLAAAAEVRRELAPAAVQTALAQVEVPLPYFDHSLFSPQHPSLLGHADSFGAARDLALAALARRVPLSAPRPAVVLRIAPPGSEEAERLAQQGSEWLHGTPQHPLPATVRQRREQQLATFVAHMVGAGRWLMGGVRVLHSSPVAA